MKIRALICDIYQTLLAVEPPPADAAERWRQLCRKLPGTAPALPLAEFDARCLAAVKQAHAAARARGVLHPEVFWPDIARAAAPSLASLAAEELDDLLYAHAQLTRTVRLMPGAAETLAVLSQRNLWLGLCSNSQPYTLRELAQALAAAGLSLELFDARLCFFSFRAGFSKPHPDVFRRLEQALVGLAVLPAETLFVGDRLDNDIHPAQARGWRTWQLAPNSVEAGMGGDWFQLLRQLRDIAPA